MYAKREQFATRISNPNGTLASLSSSSGSSAKLEAMEHDLRMSIEAPVRPASQEMGSRPRMSMDLARSQPAVRNFACPRLREGAKCDSRGIAHREPPMMRILALRERQQGRHGILEASAMWV